MVGRVLFWEGVLEVCVVVVLEVVVLEIVLEVVLVVLEVVVLEVVVLEVIVLEVVVGVIPGRITCRVYGCSALMWGFYSSVAVL